LAFIIIILSLPNYLIYKIIVYKKICQSITKISSVIVSDKRKEEKSMEEYLKERVIFLEAIIEINNATILKMAETNKLLIDELKKRAK